jgi:hypothetical protein
LVKKRNEIGRENMGKAKQEKKKVKEEDSQAGQGSVAIKIERFVKEEN